MLTVITEDGEREGEVENYLETELFMNLIDLQQRQIYRCMKDHHSNGFYTICSRSVVRQVNSGDIQNAR